MPGQSKKANIFALIEQFFRMINLKQVNSLLTVVEAGSVNQAAEKLCLAPSSVSAQLRELSAFLGITLFETSGRNLVLSAAGRQLLPEFQRLVALGNDVTERAQSLLSEPAGDLKMFAPSSMCIYRIPPLIELMQSTAPTVELQLQHDPFDYKKALAERTIEAAIVVANDIEPQFNHLTLAEEQAIYVAHPTVCGTKKLTVKQLSAYSLITTEPECSYRIAADKHFKKNRLLLSPKQCFSNVEVIRRCLLAKMGIGLLPRCVVEDDLTHGRLRELQVSGAPYRFYSTIIWPKDTCVSARLAAFLHAVETFKSTPQHSSAITDQSL